MRYIVHFLSGTMVAVPQPAQPRAYASLPSVMSFVVAAGRGFPGPCFGQKQPDTQTSQRKDALERVPAAQHPHRMTLKENAGLLDGGGF